MSVRFLAESAFWNLLSQVFSRGSLILSSIILARSLDVVEYATYSYFQLTISTLATYAAMGLAVAATKFFAEFEGASKDSEEQSRTLAAMISLSFALATIAFLLMLFLTPLLLKNTISISPWLIALGVFVLTFSSVPSGAILGFEKYRHLAFISFFTGLIYIIGSLWAAKNDNLILAITVIILATSFQTLSIIITVIIKLGWRNIYSGFPFNLSSIKKVLSFSGPMFLISIIASSATWLVGNIIIRGTGGTHSFSLFTIGMQLFSLGMLLPTQISVVLAPRLIREKSKKASRLLARKGIILTIIMALLSISTIGLLTNQFNSLYGTNFPLSSSFILSYLLAAIFATISASMGSTIIASNRPWHWLILNCIWLFSMCSLALIFQENGEFGGAIAYIGAYVILAFISIWFAHKVKLI
jgi:O-antigen/teichoic acid export membrane protein